MIIKNVNESRNLFSTMGVVFGTRGVLVGAKGVLSSTIVVAFDTEVVVFGAGGASYLVFAYYASGFPQSIVH